MYSIFKTLPHSGQRSTGRSRDIFRESISISPSLHINPVEKHTVSQIVT
jgi:hypothetical protein